MARRLTFESVPNSFSGEVLLSEINLSISPHVAYVQVDPDGSIAYVDLADDVPETADVVIGGVVAAHISSQLLSYRNDAFEMMRLLGRLKERFVRLDGLLFQYKRSGDYENTYIDRIITEIRGILSDIIRGME